jgi:lysyl-tRNA synthetase class II
MHLQGMKKIFPFVISYNGDLYVKTNKESQIGDIVQCLGKCGFTTKDNYYLVVECYSPNGFKGIIGDDEEPMGIHDSLGNFRIYRKRN